MALSDAQKVKLLAEHFMLKFLGPKDLKILVEASQTKNFSKGDVIFQKGDIAESMMVVVTGTVKISALSGNGDDVTFATISSGEVFGEIALIDGYERSADAVSLEETELLILSNRDFMPLLKNNTDLCINLLKVLCNRIRQTNILLEDFSYLELRRRLAKRLIYMSGRTSDSSDTGDMSVRVSQAQVIAVMGVSQSAVEPELELWLKAGLIERDGDWIKVTDLKQLTSISKG